MILEMVQYIWSDLLNIELCLGLIWGNILTEKGHFFSISWKYGLFPSIFTCCMWVENHNGNLILTLLANIIATFCSAYLRKNSRVDIAVTAGNGTF